jgi:hypothetical protein
MKQIAHTTLRYILSVVLLIGFCAAAQAAQLTGAIRINSDTTGTNTHSSAVSVTLQTNLNTGTITITNVPANLLVAVDASQKSRGAVEGTDYTSPGSTNAFTNKTFDSQATGNILKLLDYKDFIYLHKVDGVGCTSVTNNYTSGLSGLATYAGTGGTNANYAWFRVGIWPYDLDSGTTMKLRGIAIRVSGTDTASASFSVCYFSPASSAGFSPTDFTVGAGYVNFTTGTLTSPSADDTFYPADVTLTGWASGVTSGRPILIGIARDGGDSNNDSITLVSATVEYGRVQ